MKPNKTGLRKKRNPKDAVRAIGSFFKNRKEALKVGFSILGNDKVQIELGKTIIEAGLKKNLKDGKLSQKNFDHYSSQMDSPIYTEFAKAYGIHFAVNVIPIGVPGIKLLLKPGLMIRSRRKAKKAFENHDLSENNYREFVRLHNLGIPLGVSMIPWVGGFLAYPISLYLAKLKKKPILEKDFVLAARKGARMHLNKEGYNKLKEITTRTISENS